MHIQISYLPLEHGSDEDESETNWATRFNQLLSSGGPRAQVINPSKCVRLLNALWQTLAQKTNELPHPVPVVCYFNFCLLTSFSREKKHWVIVRRSTPFPRIGKEGNQKKRVNRDGNRINHNPRAVAAEEGGASRNDKAQWVILGVGGMCSSLRISGWLLRWLIVECQPAGILHNFLTSHMRLNLLREWF